MQTLNPRAKFFGVATILFAIVTAGLSVLLGLAALGFGAAVAVSGAKGSIGFGAALGVAGVTGACIGLIVSALKGWVGVLICQGRKLGLLLGLLFAVMGVISGFGGAWTTLAWGAFGLWALWTSRGQFR